MLIGAAAAFVGFAQRPVPIVAPVGGKQSFHPEGEIAVAKGARAGNHLMILSTATNTGVEDATAARGAPLWYQLYATNSWDVAKAMVQRAEKAGCTAVADHHYLWADSYGFDPAAVLFDTAERLGMRLALLRGGTTRIYDPRTLNEEGQIPARALGVASDNKHAVARNDDGSLGLYDLGTGKQVAPLPGSVAAASPKTPLLAVGGKDGVTLMDMP